MAELELDELDDSHSLVFVLQNPNLIDHTSLFSGRASRAPDLWLMWRQRSFNLLLAHQSSELHLNAIELNLLDDNETSGAGGGGSVRPEELPSGFREEQASTTVQASNATTGDTNDGSTISATRQRQPQQQQQIGWIGNSYIIRYEPNIVNSYVKSNENFLSRIQHNIAGNSNNNGSSFVIARNQWHKFDGRPVALVV